MKKNRIIEVLDGVKHPETGRGLAESGFVSAVNTADGAVGVSLAFNRPREPFAASLRKQAERALAMAFAEAKISVTVEEPTPKSAQPTPDGLAGIHKIVAIASGKGGVGKSSVAAYTAATLAARGYRVGLLDADVYGPSQPQLFGVEGYLPPAVSEGGVEWMVPAESMGVKVMSIGFFIGADDALVWRGPMANGALKQLIHQTLWGELDFLLVDLPPGTGDVHLTVTHEVRLDGAVIVSTPQRLAVADVKRGVEMFRAEGINVPVWGIVENMAWFTPAELPSSRYYIFGKGGARQFAAAEGLDFLGDIPIDLSVMESGEGGLPSQGLKTAVSPHYEAIVAKIVEKAGRGC
jgi:ATP-binding protein involved in chromosome partitioning